MFINAVIDFLQNHWLALTILLTVLVVWFVAAAFVGVVIGKMFKMRDENSTC